MLKKIIGLLLVLSLALTSGCSLFNSRITTTSTPTPTSTYAPLYFPPVTALPNAPTPAPAPWPDIAAYTERDYHINAKVGDEFAIGMFATNNNTYYFIDRFQYDTQFLIKVDEQVVQYQPATLNRYGTVWLLFKAIKIGDTELLFEEPLEYQKIFLVSIEASPGSEDITFETIGGRFNEAGGSYDADYGWLQTSTNNQTQSSPAIDWVTTSDQETILTVDYSKYFVIMAFNGFRGALYSDFKIQRIWQDYSTNTIFVIARFNDPNEELASAFENSQYEAVKIARRQVVQPGVITFKLLDETGKERARTTYQLNP